MAVWACCQFFIACTNREQFDPKHFSCSAANMFEFWIAYEAYIQGMYTISIIETYWNSGFSERELLCPASIQKFPHSKCANGNRRNLVSHRGWNQVFEGRWNHWSATAFRTLPSRKPRMNICVHHFSQFWLDRSQPSVRVDSTGHSNGPITAYASVNWLRLNTTFSFTHGITRLAGSIAMVSLKGLSSKNSAASPTISG